MYDYKRFHGWLLVTSFWVLHTFGSPSILSSLSKYGIFCFGKTSVSSNAASNSVREEINFSDLVDPGKPNLAPVESGANCQTAQFLTDQFGIDHFYFDEKSCSIKAIDISVKKGAKKFIDDVCVCDNRVSDVGKKFAAYLCSGQAGSQSVCSVVVA